LKAIYYIYLLTLKRINANCLNKYKDGNNTMKNFSARISETHFDYIEELKNNFGGNRSKAIEFLINEHKKQELSTSKILNAISEANIAQEEKYVKLAKAFNALKDSLVED